ncbi:MAG: response regulator [Gammaproteobacteria bacterium]|jgi:hypothetical protein|nr:response regulator [Gammaproteobacteria bacterium]MBT4607887.1 response regulator [Thiotrichales bacterium]MBT3472050.1 response regulator [Gammaproteobacteria bacterium]MBT3967319.1 response regulator [Gammaproteobacteria bacterium]MBT4080491.1 response regulator [Gammaproteobacteria bacterium]
MIDPLNDAVASLPILVVDDKPENLYAFEGALSQAGFSVVTARSGNEALQYLMKHRVSLILLDVQMPEMNGFELASIIRQSAGGEEVPVLFISATQNTSEFIKHGYAVGAYDYLTKPIDDEILINKVRLFHTLYCQKRELEQRHQATEALNAALQNNEVLKQAVDTAERATQAKDEFLASMSHELRTPLTSIIGNSDLMVETPLNHEQRELLESMAVSGKSLLYLINDILDTSKIEAGKFAVDRVEFDLLAVIHELNKIFKYRAEQSGLRFQVETQVDTTLLCVGDDKRITQVLVNLLGNAIKFTSAGLVQLTVTEEPSSSSLKFEVEDSGIGMDQEAVGRLFQPFEQANQSISGSYGGTGLGLYISSTLTALMGGELSVESEPGRGSRFELILPLERVKRPETVTLAPQAGHKLALKGRILIAEDDPGLQLLEKRMVEPLGVEVECANNGAEAVEMALSGSYDLILMDMQMPIMSGIDATSTLRERGYQGPIIALTANVMEKHRKQFEAAGCTQFLSKPIDRKALKEVLVEFCSC